MQRRDEPGWHAKACHHTDSHDTDWHHDTDRHDKEIAR